MNAFNDGVEELVDRKCKDHYDVIRRELGLGQKNITPFRATSLLLLLLLVIYCVGYSGSRGPSSLMLEWAYGNRLLVSCTWDFFWHVVVSFICLSTLDVNIGLCFTLIVITGMWIVSLWHKRNAGCSLGCINGIKGHREHHYILHMKLHSIKRTNIIQKKKLKKNSKIKKSWILNCLFWIQFL
jgi:hypothetical protein